MLAQPGRKREVRERSYTQFQTFSLCPRKWYLSRKYEPRVKALALSEGGVVHRALASLYTNGTWREEFSLAENECIGKAESGGSTPEFVGKLREKLASAGAMMQVYESGIFRHDLDRFGVRATESKFSVAVARGLRLGGIVDAVWQDKTTDARYIVEHKYKSEHHEALMALDLQVSLYTFAMIKEFEATLPTLYNVIKKPAYRRKEGESLDDFKARVLEKVSEEMQGFQHGPEFESKYFIRRAYTRGRTDLKTVVAQIIEVNKRMNRVLRHPETAYRNVGEHCLYGCPFGKICMDEDELLVGQFFDRIEKEVQAVKPV